VTPDSPKEHNRERPVNGGFRQLPPDWDGYVGQSNNSQCETLPACETGKITADARAGISEILEGYPVVIEKSGEFKALHES